MVTLAHLPALKEFLVGCSKHGFAFEGRRTQFLSLLAILTEIFLIGRDFACLEKAIMTLYILKAAPTDFVNLIDQIKQDKRLCISCKILLRLHNVCAPSGILNNLIPSDSKRLILWRFNATGNSKPYLVLHVKCPLFFSSFNQIWIFSTDFPRTFQYKISQKSLQWEPY